MLTCYADSKIGGKDERIGHKNAGTHVLHGRLLDGCLRLWEDGILRSTAAAVHLFAAE